MKKSVIFYLLLFMVSLTAAEKNLVMNGEFKMDGKVFPPFWMFRTHSPSQISGFASGGPDNKSFLRIEGKRAYAYVQQNNLVLVKGETYRISAKVRTKNLTGKNSGVTVHPGDGKGLMNLPENQSEWLYVEGGTTVPVDKQHYTVSIQVDAPDAVLDITELKLVPLSEKAAEKSKRQIENIHQALVPLFLLEHFDLKKSRAEFVWTGEMPGNAKNMSSLQCVFSLNGKNITVPFSTKKMVVDLKKLVSAPGQGVLKLGIKDKTSGKEVFSQQYKMRFISLPEMKSGKKLNNLVSELFSGKVAAGKSVKIGNPRNGWLYIAASGNDSPLLTLNGKTVLEKDYPHHSTVRKVAAGEYTLKNCGSEVQITVRSIPDIHMFPLGSCRVPGNDAYDWEFAKKYMLPAFTTINVSGMTPAERAESARFGLLHIANFGVLNPAKPNDRDDLLRRMNEFKDFKSPMFDGMSMDEVEYWDAPAVSPYTWALKNFANPGNKEIRSWVIGPPSVSYADYISTGCNVSGGWGRILYEVYNRQQFTEAESKAYIRQTAQHIGSYRDIAPQLLNNISVILGNFSQPPMLSLDQIPYTDYKYYLDMQMFEIANDPLFDGLGGIGFWGSHSCDEEMLRWCFALLKHYAIDGNKNMLSGKYGFKFLPGIVKNGDFEEGLEHWQVKGDVATGYKKGYGVKMQNRYGSNFEIGDRFAVITRKEGEASEIRQKLTGLTPGKKYTIFYMVADYDDILTGKNDSRRHQLSLNVENSNIVRKSYFVDDRKGTKYKVRMNSCKYVFVPKGESVELVFSNRKAKPGTRLALNYISVRPYFDR